VLTAFGATAVTLMMVTYALERRHTGSSSGVRFAGRTVSLSDFRPSA
jgi:hypothetical protein